MAAPEFTYTAYHPVARTQLAQLNVRQPEWVEAVNGASTLTFKVTVPDDPFQVARIRQATEPDEAAIYVSPGLSRYSWGGVVKKRLWSSANNEFTVTCVEWRSLAYGWVLGPKTDLSGSNTYTWTATDQFTIARALVAAVAAEGPAGGVPVITSGIELSGVTRDLTVLGTSFRTLGSYLDELSQRDRGFEWDLEPYTDTDGRPSLRFNCYMPERGGFIPTLMLDSGGSLLGYGDIEESSENRAARVWAVGEGPNAESLPYSVDEDPDLYTGFILRADKVTQYQTVYDRTVLASHARAERDYLQADLSLLTVVVRLDSPNYLSYTKGDRGRLTIKDRVYDIDLAGVRILERKVMPQNGGGIAALVLNLNDTDAPQTDEGGSV